MPLSYPEAFELSVELHRSSHRRCSKTKGVLNILAKFVGKHQSQTPFFDKRIFIKRETLVQVLFL